MLRLTGLVGTILLCIAAVIFYVAFAYGVTVTSACGVARYEEEPTHQGSAKTIHQRIKRECKYTFDLHANGT